MPLKHGYGVLKGRPIDFRPGGGANPHYQIHVVDEQDDWRVPVNVRSKLAPSEVEFLIVSRFAHPIVDALRKLPLGFTKVKSEPGGVALDYIRGNLLEPSDFRPLPFNVSGPDNDLNEKIDQYVQRAMADEEALIYAFGEPWGPENIKDKIFQFKPNRGVHDIHMNQGNIDLPGTKDFVADNGVWQDGGLILHFPSSDPLAEQWVAIFLKFGSQSWHTDDRTGHALPPIVGGAPSDNEDTTIVPPNHLPTGDMPDGLVRIVGALVNAIQSPERETVTILNTSPRSIDLAGWAIADKNKHRQALTASIAPGAVRVIEVTKPVELSNKGGLISLLDETGRKVHGVAYTKEQAAQPGWTIVF